MNEKHHRKLKSHEVTCSCPTRSKVPDKPCKLPFKATSEKVSKMSEWLLQRYAASKFNLCPHKPLNQMSGPPLKIHLENNAKPRNFHTPAHVQIHWQKQVEADLIRDKKVGVLERVPFGEPVILCHRMFITRKQNGPPRKYCRSLTS